MPVLETEFLFALRKEDKRHALCSTILEIAKDKSNDLAICGSAFVEIAIGLRGTLSRSEIITTLESSHALVGPIKEIPLHSGILLSGLVLEQTLGTSNLFDCLHAATALSHDSMIVSDDHFYDEVPNLRRVSFRDFVKASNS